MEKKDYFYYACYYGVPIYLQPEENEIVARNKLCNFLLDYIAIPIGIHLGHRIKVYKKTITRQELIQKGLLEEENGM